jgi:hypothetical protein
MHGDYLVAERAKEASHKCEVTLANSQAALLECRTWAMYDEVKECRPWYEEEEE